LEQISSAIHSKAVIAGQRRCTPSIQLAVTSSKLNFPAVSLRTLHPITKNQFLPFSAHGEFRTQSNLHRIGMQLILLRINRRTACCGAALFLTAQAHYIAEGSS
jgi:hypothetical protein